MNKEKYQQALNTLFMMSSEHLGFELNYEKNLLQELVDKATPTKPKMVRLFGEYVPICHAKNCGVGLVEEETIWHKSSYCGRCGQALDWTKND